MLVVAGAMSGCDVNKALERVAQGRALSGDLHLQFTRAVDAGNRAVMADTDESSVAFAREAEAATGAAQKDADALAPILHGLGFSDEVHLLEEFDKRFAAYKTLDRTILDLAVENTNLKAQRLSFGAAQAAVDALRDSLGAVTPAKDVWQVKALAAAVVASAREIQALQAPHIAEADEADMTSLETRMFSAESEARSALKTLTSLVQPASRPQLAAATADLDRLMTLNAQIVGLSRRNSNVRSLALSLNEKRTATAACEESLRALGDALAKRGFTSTR